MRKRFLTAPKKWLRLSLLTFLIFSFTFPTSAFATTIVLDPGHSLPNRQGQLDPNYTDSKLKVGENDGAPGERAAMQATADLVEQYLKKDGYNVVMTKTSPDQYVSLRERAEIANRNHADLAVSLHYDNGHAFGSWGEIYAQQVGLSRYNGSSNNRQDEKKFDLPDIAQKSQQYAQAFKTERNIAEGHMPDVTTDSFDTRGPGFSGGNIPMVQLFAKVPWVYNETGGKGFNKTKYAEGIYNGIKKAISSTGGNGSTGGNTVSCVITKVGNPKTPPPPLPQECNGGAGGSSGTGPSGKCGAVIDWAQKISDNLSATRTSRSGSMAGNGYDTLTQPVTSTCRPNDPNLQQKYAQYWCTLLIIDSYALAGVPIAENAGVVAMRQWWKSASGFKYVDYANPGQQLKQVTTGYAMMMESSAGVHTGHEHVDMVKSITIDGSGNGKIVTLDANSSAKSHTFPVSGWQIKNTPYPVRGFGGK